MIFILLLNIVLKHGAVRANRISVPSGCTSRMKPGQLLRPDSGGFGVVAQYDFGVRLLAISG